MIVTLRLKNFKSFRRAEIPFSEGFTAIAGANASGKSNILDAILFALGTTSLKSLRAAKLTELVNHDASEGYAKVELVIRDSGGKGLTVTRIVDRSGKSIYKLDDKRKNLNEIQSLLLELGISPSGHNIVVQGDITRIIEMNSKERLEIIKESAGLAEFEEKKAEALRKLEQVELRVKDTLLVLKERETYLQQIEKDRENALKYNRLHEEMRRSKATILSEEIKVLRKELEAGAKEIAELQKEVDDKRGLRDSLQKEEIGLEKKAEELTNRLIDASEKIYSTFGREVEQKKAQLALIEEKTRSKSEGLELKKTRKAGIRQETEQLRETKSVKAEELKNAQAELKTILEEILFLEKEIHAGDPQSEKQQRLEAEYEDRLSELTVSIEEFRERLHSLRIEMSGFENERKSNEVMFSELRSRLDSLEQRNRKRKELESQYADLKKLSPAQKAQDAERELEAINSEMHNLGGRKQALEDAIKSISRSNGECPTCERPVDSAKKTDLLSSKASEMEKIGSKIGSLLERKNSVYDQKNEFAAKERELSALALALSGYSGLLDEISAVREKINQVKTSKPSGRLGEVAGEEQEVLQNIGSLEQEREGIIEKLNGIKQSRDTKGLNEKLGRLKELNARKSRNENLTTRLKTELESAINEKISSLGAEYKSIDLEMGEYKKSVEEMGQQKQDLEKEIKKMETELEKAKKGNVILEEEKERVTRKISGLSEKRDALTQKIEAREKEINRINLELSKHEVRVIDIEEESKAFAAVRPFEEFQLNTLRKRIPEIEREIEKLGAVNMKSVENFDLFKNEVDEVKQRALKLDEEKNSVLDMISKIEVRKTAVFMECFTHVSSKFSELYYKFFEGEGLLELTNRQSPLEGGLLVQAKYKEDTMKSIDAMSGGEKSLTALAFIFALQSFTPAPFYILDEIDAALDKTNSVKVGRMVKEQSSSSQFIMISHNDSVINQAGQIVGVALNKKKSSVIGLKLKKDDKMVFDGPEGKHQEQGAEN